MRIFFAAIFAKNGVSLVASASFPNSTEDVDISVGPLFPNDIFTRAGCNAGIPLYDDDKIASLAVVVVTVVVVSLLLPLFVELLVRKPFGFSLADFALAVVGQT